MTEIKELNKWRDVPCSWMGGLNTVKLSVLPNLIYRFNAVSIKIPAIYFTDISKMILKFIWRCKRLRIAKTSILKKTEVTGLALPNFKTDYIATVIKTVWYWGKNEQIDQQNRIESPETDPHK